MTTRSAVSFALILCAAATVTCGGDRPPTAPSEVQIQAPPPPPAQTFTLSGVVTSYAGRPVPGVAVTLNDNSGGRETTTDGGGRYGFDKTGGAVQITAALAGYHDDHRVLTMTRDVVLDLELTPPITINAGQETSAELHRGPQSTACLSFLGTVADPCRPVTVRIPSSGTLRASVTWNGAPGLALTQIVDIFPGIGLPKYGPSVCCESGQTLQVPVTQGRFVSLIVRLHDARISPVQFTLRTSVE